MLCGKSGLLGLTLAGLAISQSVWAQDRGNNRAEQPRNNPTENREARSADQNRRADDSDTWAEWFADWWSSDENQRGDKPEDTAEQKSARRAQGFLARYDADADGKLQRSELPEQMRDGFKQLDRNSDQAIDRQELEQHAIQASQRTAGYPVQVTYYWVVDANQGRIDLNDLQSAYALLRKIDDDNDGHISRSELRDRQKKVATHWINRTFERFDDDDDDRLTLTEVSGSGLITHFNRLDQNGNGFVSRSELRSECQLISAQSDDSASAASNSKSSVKSGYRGVADDKSDTSAQDKSAENSADRKSRDDQRENNPKGEDRSQP